jgi:hypothetical protein
MGLSGASEIGHLTELNGHEFTLVAQHFNDERHNLGSYFCEGGEFAALRASDGAVIVSALFSHPSTLTKFNLLS